MKRVETPTAHPAPLKRIPPIPNAFIILFIYGNAFIIPIPEAIDNPTITIPIVTDIIIFNMEAFLVKKKTFSSPLSHKISKYF